jgi:3-deoxy-D-manno-octulosonic acid kinase
MIDPLPFVWLRRGPCALYVAEPLRGAAEALGLLEPGRLEELLAHARGPTGRARTAVLELPGHPEALHLRPLRHGGLFAKLLGSACFGLRRPRNELRVCAGLAARGAPVARPALLAARRRMGPVWRAALGTVHERGAVSGLEFLCAAPARERVERAAAAAGRALRRFHEAGGRHADLHVGNLLLREGTGEPEVLVIDLDRARLGAAPDAGARMAELMRLYRSLVKRGLTGAMGARGCARFLASYTGGDRELRRALLRHLPRERRRLALHELGYRLSNRLSKP